jgi:hypothetical protein
MPYIVLLCENHHSDMGTQALPTDLLQIVDSIFPLLFP